MQIYLQFSEREYFRSQAKGKLKFVADCKDLDCQTVREYDNFRKDAAASGHAINVYEDFPRKVAENFCRLNFYSYLCGKFL